MTYRIVDRDAGNEKIIEADSMQDAIARAREWALGGIYDEPLDDPFVVRVMVEEIDRDGLVELIYVSYATAQEVAA